MDAWTFLREAHVLHIAAVVDGRPMLRTMHAAVFGEKLVLHGAPKGGKATWMGAPVVASAEQVVARIPSWMRHPERACPATTYYRSVHVEGELCPLDDADERAAALQALMDQLQPEGGYRPLAADDPLYATTVRGLGMWAIEVERTSVKEKLGQHIRGAEMASILAGLWRRGAPGDLAAIEALSAAHPERPSFVALAGEEAGLRARCHPTSADLATLVQWLRDAYWNAGFDDAVLAEAHRHGPWVGLELAGQLVASARAVTDHAKRAWIYDVIVDPAHRGRGLGTQLVGLLLDHPHLRDVACMHLGTRDAMPLYARHGFVDDLVRGEGDARRTIMLRDARTRTRAAGR